jgi:Sulfotransferase family
MDYSQKITQPVFIIGCPRSGTSLLFDLLARSTKLWTSYREEHGIYEWDIGLHPDYCTNQGNRLTSTDVTEERKHKITKYLYQVAGNLELLGLTQQCSDLRRPLAMRLTKKVKNFLKFPIKIIDKNPKNCYRISFLSSLFPDAKFIFLFRDSQTNVNSLIEGWEYWKTYEVPLNFDSPTAKNTTETEFWSHLLPLGHQQYAGKSIQQKAAFVWVSCNQAILESDIYQNSNLSTSIYYEKLISNPEEEIARLCQFLGLEFEPIMRKASQKLQVVNSISAPDPDKWLKRKEQIDSVCTLTLPIRERLGYEEG